MSIRNRLMLRLLIASFLLIGGGMWLGYQDVRHETRELFDAQLARSARLILSLVQADPGRSSFSSVQKYLDQNQVHASIYISDEYTAEDKKELSDGHTYETKLGFQIWDNLGNLILKSPNVPITPISEKTNGYSNNHFKNDDWRIFSLTSIDKKYRCITAERIDVRNDLTGKISSDLSSIFIIIIPVLLLTMWFTIKQGMSPLYKLASQIRNRGAEKLDSVSNDNAPSEIKIITDELNQLLSRLKNTLAREKRITSDAAHELRTPLAAVKLHAELAKTASNADERKKSIDQVMLGIDRTTHLVEQLLTLARLEPESFSKKLKPLNVSQLIIEETALLAPLALNKNIELSLNENQNITITAEEVSLRLLVRNLINNAISYTQEGGDIEVLLSIIDSTPCLVIKDNGPGIPPEDRERVLERFYRAENHSTPGCGIGLSIVVRVTELHNATLKMDSPESGSGLIVTVCFPSTL